MRPNSTLRAVRPPASLRPDTRQSNVPDSTPDALAQRYREVRAHTVALAAPLSAEDLCVQSMPDASPGKWHLAHGSWFFETVVLKTYAAGYREFNPRFGYLFNSYYESLGRRHPRPHRGLLTRPSLAEVLDYRVHVDAAMLRLLEDGLLADAQAAGTREALALIALGLQHEQQHQELLLTDALHLLWSNPLLPAYSQAREGAVLAAPAVPQPLRFLPRPGGIVEIGHGDAAAFAFDNETPRHPVLLAPYAMADRLVNCGEFADFIADGGYRRPELWLSDGWAAAQAGGWQAPAYWIAPGDERAPAAHWQVFGLQGVQALQPAAPVSQLSFYEAAAFAEWAGARLPTEFEWEAACDAPGIVQLNDHVWQWTRSSYDPYPGFKPLTGAVGEYNGKFMVGQVVLRGASVATPAGHTRRSYRNFFAPGARWQFSGVRLAKDGASC